jgi:energy-converting hydrogenase Eha subunit E
MSFKLGTQHLHCGDDCDPNERHLDSEKNAVGGAMVWLAFYAMAAVIGVISNSHHAANIVIAAAN